MNHVHIAADNTAKFISFEEAQLLNWEGVQNCRDWKTIEDAERVAELLNKSDKNEDVFPSGRYYINLECPVHGDK